MIDSVIGMPLSLLIKTLLIKFVQRLRSRVIPIAASGNELGRSASELGISRSELEAWTAELERSAFNQKAWTAELGTLSLLLKICGSGLEMSI